MTSALGATGAGPAALGAGPGSPFSRGPACYGGALWTPFLVWDAELVGHSGFTAR